MTIFNSDCISNAIKIPDKTIDLMICDPPFGINETKFHQHYNRDEATVLPGYQEAPDNYEQFTEDWLTQAKRVMKDNASLYLFSGWSNLLPVLDAVNRIGFFTINHLIWRYNFGVFTSKKYCSSHYHILYLKKHKNAVPTFNTYCRFGSQEKRDGRSLLYEDLQDVFCINKEYQPGEIKNANKLPDQLIEKLVLYSSNPGDAVCDFFLGNFTTAIVAKKLGRKPYGFEINKESFDYGMEKLNAVEDGSGLSKLKVVENSVPANQGKPISEEEASAIQTDFLKSTSEGHTKKSAIELLGEKYGRGRFSILNIIKQPRSSQLE